MGKAILSDGRPSAKSLGVPTTEEVNTLVENATKDLPTSEEINEAINASLGNIDAYSKAETLSDIAKSLFGFDKNATPNDVFMKLSVPHGSYGFKVTTIFNDGAIVPFVYLNGLVDVYGNTVITDENGIAYGCSTIPNPTLTISDYVGVVSKDEVVSAQDGVAFTPITITLTRDSELHLFQSSQSLHVIPGIPVDMCLVGGGGGGRISGSGGAGGGGGYVTNILDVTLSDPDILLAVGAGGASGGGNGGASSITYNGITETIEGASGATGNGSGADSSVGGDGTVRVFNDDTLPLPGGAGGAGSNGAQRKGGADFGGMGSRYTGQGHTPGSAGTGPGGGGGGGFQPGAGGATPAYAGAAGGLYIRVNHGSEVSV